MNQLKNFRYTVVVTTLLVITISCSKYDPPKCELWEVRDYEYSTGNSGCGIDWSCGGSRTIQLNFCGEALNDARVGNTIVIRNEPCCKKTRTFIRKA